jgi:hypothetical protein
MDVKTKIKATKEQMILSNIIKKKTTCQKHGYTLVCSLIGLGMIVSGVWTNVYKETKTYISTPNAPVVIIIDRAEASTEKTIKNLDDEQVSDVMVTADYIWMKESTRGQNNYSKCEEKGLINGTGYAIPGDGTYVCFNNHAEEMATVIEWIKKHQDEGMTNLQLLCHYSGNNYKECKPE